MWLKMFFDWLLRKKVKVQPAEMGAPAPPTKKGSLKDISNFCDEMRKDLWIKKKTDDRLYVEMGSLKDKIERFLQRRESK